MRIYLAGLLALAALAALATFSVSSVEARGRRCGGGSCNQGCGVFQGGGIFHRHAHTAQCGVNGCGVGTTAIVGSEFAPTTQLTQPQIVEDGPQAAPQRIQQAIQVRDSQGRIYYLVPQSQYEKLAAPK